MTLDQLLQELSFAREELQCVCDGLTEQVQQLQLELDGMRSILGRKGSEMLHRRARASAPVVGLGPDTDYEPLPDPEGVADRPSGGSRAQSPPAQENLDPDLSALLGSFPGADPEVRESVVAAYDELQLRYRDKLSRWRQELAQLEQEAGCQVGMPTRSGTSNGCWR